MTLILLLALTSYGVQRLAELPGRYLLFRGTTPLVVPEPLAWVISYWACFGLCLWGGYGYLASFPGFAGGLFLHRLDGYLMARGDVALSEAVRNMRR